VFLKTCLLKSKQGTKITAGGKENLFMKTAKIGRKQICKGIFILSGVILLGLLSPLRAEEFTAKIPWKCINLLDEETKSLLISQEKYFAGLFLLPDGYNLASQQAKEEFVRQWIIDLQDSDFSKVTQAAAWLGMAKAKQAVRFLEKTAEETKNGRLRWVATRSLGQIDVKTSVPVLINLLEASNKDTRVYARVSLAEITGVYLGEDNEKWRTWQAGKTLQYSKTEENPKIDSNSISAPRNGSNTNNPNIQAVQTLRRLVDEKYSYRDLRGVNWDNMFSLYGPKMERAKTKEEFADIAAGMLSAAKDKHVWVKIGDQTIGGFKRTAQRNCRIDKLERKVPNWTRHNDRVSTGRFEGGIGYILITNWDSEDRKTLEPAFTALKTFSDCRGLIVDIRPNGGGSEDLAAEFAGCFIDKSVIYAKHIYRDIKYDDGWSKVNSRAFKPVPDRPSYHGKIAVLMGDANMSAAEAFLLMMKQVPNCKLIGDKSYGASGKSVPYGLGNGVTVWLPSWKAMLPDGTFFEGIGIKPDIPVKTNENELRQRDAVLEKALKYLQSSKM
jgi:hypothetical protein